MWDGGGWQWEEGGETVGVGVGVAGGGCDSGRRSYGFTPFEHEGEIEER